MADLTPPRSDMDPLLPSGDPGSSGVEEDMSVSPRMTLDEVDGDAGSSTSGDEAQSHSGGEEEQDHTRSIEDVGRVEIDSDVDIDIEVEPEAEAEGEEGPDTAIATAFNAGSSETGTEKPSAASKRGRTARTPRSGRSKASGPPPDSPLSTKTALLKGKGKKEADVFDTEVVARWHKDIGDIGVPRPSTVAPTAS